MDELTQDERHKLYQAVGYSETENYQQYPADVSFAT